jgi:hypothetical protein
VTDWTCVECGLPDPHHGQGDGIGSCGCPRCDCGECRYCADQLGGHGEACADDQGDAGWDDDEDYDAGRWLDENPGPPTVTLTVQEGLL